MQKVCERFLNNKHEDLDILCINNMNINLQRSNFWHEYNFRFWKAMKINIQEITNALFRNLLILENVGFRHSPISRHTTGHVCLPRSFWPNARKLSPGLTFLVIKLFKCRNRYNRDQKIWEQGSFLRWREPMNLKWPYSFFCKTCGHRGPPEHCPFEPGRSACLSYSLGLTGQLDKDQCPSKRLLQ